MGDHACVNIVWIINLCKKAKIKKIVYTSGLGVSKLSSLGYFISKYHAEKMIIESKLDYTIFRPSYIVGEDDLFTKYLKKQIKKREIQIAKREIQIAKEFKKNGVSIALIAKSTGLSEEEIEQL